MKWGVVVTIFICIFLIGIVNANEIWIEYSTAKFDTIDGDLELNEYALDEVTIDNITSWFIRTIPKGQGNFEITYNPDDIKGKKEVKLLCRDCSSYSEYIGLNGFKERQSSLETKENFIQRIINLIISFFSGSFIPLVSAAVPDISNYINASSTAVTSIEVNYTISGNSNRKLIISCGGKDNANTAFSLATYNGINSTLISTARVSASSLASLLEQYYIDQVNLPSTGTYTTNCTAAATIDNFNIHVIELYNAEQGTPDNFTNGTISAGGTTITANVTSTEAGMVISSGTIGDPRTSAAPGTNQFTWGLTPAGGTGAGNVRSTNESLSGAITDNQTFNWATSGQRRSLVSVVISGSADTQAPNFSNIMVNNTSPQILDTVLFSVLWNENINLNTTIFSINDSGAGCDTFVNTTNAGLTGNVNWSNFSHQIPATCLLANVPKIAWRVYTNDTANNLNVSTTTFSFSAGADDCTCTNGSAWTIDDGSSCQLTNYCNLGANPFRLMNGALRITSTGKLNAKSCYVEKTESLFVDKAGGLICRP